MGMMEMIGLDLHKRESELASKAEDRAITGRRIVTSRERCTAVLGLGAIGMIPGLLTKPSVGLIPTIPLIDDSTLAVERVRDRKRVWVDVEHVVKRRTAVVERVDSLQVLLSDRACGALAGNQVALQVEDRRFLEVEDRIVPVRSRLACERIAKMLADWCCLLRLEMPRSRVRHYGENRVFAVADISDCNPACPHDCTASFGR